MPNDELTLQRAYHAWLVGRTARRARTPAEATITVGALDREQEAIDSMALAHHERSQHGMTQ